MKKYIFIYLILLSEFSAIIVFGGFDFKFDHVRSKADDITQETTVKNLIERLIKDKVKFFDVRVNSDLFFEEKDVFKVFKTNSSSVVEITGSSGVAVAWGFHHYLKYYCKCHISWDGDQLSLNAFPDANETIIANDRFRYYQNVCTTSYSYTWWTIDRWIREIDWMALNGINLALAFSGQEEIWRRVYVKLGLRQDEIDDHFTGPAFLAWGRMGNIRGWGGPLPVSWHNNSVKLQTKILEHMRNLGITPVLPAFAGQVPVGFKRLFPNSSLVPFEKWNHFPDKFCCPYLLSPEDPLFGTVGKIFLEEYISEFGTNHIYNCDTFNEMIPSSGDLNYLKAIGESIYNAMLTADDNAIWVLQGWLFESALSFWTVERTKAFLTSIPFGKMIVLDLQAELNPQYKRLDSFFGQPFIWCMLHNFGGTLGMHGTVTQVNEGPFKARNDKNSTLVGTGLTPEGINQNYVVYDLMNEMGWRKTPVNLTKWFEDYSVRRYGLHNLHAKRFWFLLKESVYNYKGNVAQHGKYIFVHPPNLHLKANLWYDKDYVMNAWDESIKCLESWPSSLAFTETFLYDIVDISRQSFQLLLDDSYIRLIKMFKSKNLQLFKKECIHFLSLLKDMEHLLSSHKAFLLKPWIESAKSLGTSLSESNLYEINARNQITLWGPNGEIKDYANKQWAGLIHHYYYERWKMFFDYMEKCLTDQIKFNQTFIEESIFKGVEHPFSFSTDPIVEIYSGNTSEVVKKIYQKCRTRDRSSNFGVFIV